jgi:predicted metal-dependent phosphoesterase TrpH
MNIDLHVHCRERSNCSRAGENELIEAAKRAGLDALAFTDHDRLAPLERLDELNRQYTPFRIFGGVEVSLTDEHVVVLGIRHRSLESLGWNYEALWHFVREQGGFMILAHPFRYRDSIRAPIERFPPDAIEVYSINTAIRYEPRIREIAGQLGIRLLSDSDSHTTGTVGMFYNQVTQDVETDQALIQVLRQEQPGLVNRL